jgi:hypothetical protein
VRLYFRISKTNFIVLVDLNMVGEGFCLYERKTDQSTKLTRLNAYENVCKKKKKHRIRLCSKYIKHIISHRD